MQGAWDEEIEEYADLVSSRWHAVLSRLRDKGFTRSESFTLTTVLVLASAIGSIDVTMYQSEEQEE